MNTVLEKEEFWITYAGRNIIHLFSIIKQNINQDKYHTNYAKAITPYVYESINYIPAEIECIQLYDSLTQYIDYESNLELERLVFGKCRDKYDKILSHKIGGNNIISTCETKKRDLLEGIKVAVVNTWLPNHRDIILIGSWANNLIKLGSAKLCVSPDRLQLISMKSPVEIKELLEKFLHEELHTNIHITEPYNANVYIPKEYRLNKTTFSINLPGNKEKHFLDVYNTTTYEIYPAIVVDDISVGSRYVLLRYLFIDVWNIEVQHTFNIIDKNKYLHLLRHLFSAITQIRDMKEIKPKLAIGRHIDPYIYRQRYAKEKKNEQKKERGSWFYPYIPDIVYNIKGELQWI